VAVNAEIVDRPGTNRIDAGATRYFCVDPPPPSGRVSGTALRTRPNHHPTEGLTRYNSATTSPRRFFASSPHANRTSRSYTRDRRDSPASGCGSDIGCFFRDPTGWGLFSRVEPRWPGRAPRSSTVPTPTGIDAEATRRLLHRPTTIDRRQ